MTRTDRVAAVLAATPGVPLPVATVAEQAGITSEQAQATLSRLAVSSYHRPQDPEIRAVYDRPGCPANLLGYQYE